MVTDHVAGYLVSMVTVHGHDNHGARMREITAKEARSGFGQRHPLQPGPRVGKPVHPGTPSPLYFGSRATGNAIGHPVTPLTKEHLDWTA